MIEFYDYKYKEVQPFLIIVRINMFEKKFWIQTEIHSSRHQHSKQVLGLQTEDQSSVCNLLWKLSSTKETSQAFSIHWLSAPFAKVSLPLYPPRSDGCVFQRSTGKWNTRKNTENRISHAGRVPTLPPGEDGGAAGCQKAGLFHGGG